jgi:uncharacterized SAM-binding protein YcdF (DUF218 family)
MIEASQYILISKRRLGRAVGFVLIVLLLALILHRLWLPALAQVFIVDETPVMADAIVILGGGSGDRDATGARLYAEGYAPLVVTTGGSIPLPGLPEATWASLSAAELARRGVPADRIIQVPNSTTTCEDAQFTIAALPPNITRVILVTDPFHTRRAEWVFQRELGAVEVVTVAASPSWFEADRWWTDERGIIVVGQEYVKFALTLLRGC